MDSFFPDKFKVNMGTKKDLGKKELMQQLEKERDQRRLVKLQNESAVTIQKMLRSHVSNGKVAFDILETQKAD